jgi:CRP-like cAMP-binding protein
MKPMVEEQLRLPFSYPSALLFSSLLFLEIPQHGDIGTRERELARLILLTGRNTSSKLSFEETQAIASHLKSNVNQFKNLLSSRGIEEVSMEAMTKMISKCKVMELQRVSSYDQLTRNEPTQEDILFKKGKISNASALILSGKIGILAGKEHFHSELGAWSMIGADALRSNDGTYLPDFTAYVISDTVRVLWITKTDINHIFNEAEMPSVALAREEKRKRKLLQHTSPPPLSSSISGQSIPGIQSNGHQEQAINPLHIEVSHSLSLISSLCYLQSFNQETKAGSENGNNGAPRTIFKGGNAYESLDDNV